MKITALFLAILSAASASDVCTKWSFKCATDSFLCGASLFEAQEKSVKGAYIEGGDACPGLLEQANKGGDVYSYKCPNGHAISHYTNWCTQQKCESTTCYNGPAPAGPGPKAGGGGDPHFRTFDGTKYSFHGECDLVMARSVKKDIDVHVRTHSMGSWSLISNAVVRVGSDVLEFENDGSHYINGSPLDLPFALAGRHSVTKEVDMFETQEGETIERQSMLVDLGNGDNIRMTNFKGMIFVHFGAYFDDIEGMLGVHGVSGLAGRDGSVVSDADAMGAEWQVRDSDRMLFREIRFPQYPQTCVPPTTSRRRLLAVSSEEMAAAENACAGVDDFSMHFCIEDVLLTGDASHAEGYLFGEAF